MSAGAQGVAKKERGNSASCSGAPLPKLSKLHREVLEQLCEKKLIRLAGGFWTVEGTPTEQRFGYEAPLWHIGIQTVRAMEKRGLLERTRTFLEEWRDPRRATACGKEALK